MPNDRLEHCDTCRVLRMHAAGIAKRTIARRAGLSFSSVARIIDQAARDYWALTKHRRLDELTDPHD